MTDINLEIYRGRTTELNLYCIQNSIAYDLTGGTLWMTAKRALTDADSVAVFQLTSPSGGIVITDATAGQALITIASTDTSELAYAVSSLIFDVQLKLANGKIFTVASGTITVKPNVTRATS